jgi:hypothetical protein
VIYPVEFPGGNPIQQGERPDQMRPVLLAAITGSLPARIQPMTRDSGPINDVAGVDQIAFRLKFIPDAVHSD